MKHAPEVLVDREVDRRLEELVRRLMEQGVDPMKANIDWQQFREGQRQPAAETVKSTLVLDEIARREQIEADGRATSTGRSSASPSARGARRRRYGRRSKKRMAASIGIRAGIRREKTMNWLIEKANIIR